MLHIDRNAKTPRAGLSRRLAVAAAFIAPFLFRHAATAAQPQQDVVDMLVARAEQQAKLFNSGRMQTWYDLVRLGRDFTLMQPFGGTASHGFDPARLPILASRFQNGDATIEVEQTLASDDLVVIAYIERNTGNVHGLPDQDWSLRVTQVFQRDGAEWNLMHRHADPLVRSIPLETLSALAAGRELEETAGAAH